MTNNVARCKHCGSTNVYGISRVVGFFSKIEDWNKSKRAEFKDRQKGKYSVENSKIIEKECIKVEE
jgi:anaerobic ribonucleoside-triphosphate reductase